MLIVNKVSQDVIVDMILYTYQKKDVKLLFNERSFDD